MCPDRSRSTLFNSPARQPKFKFWAADFFSVSLFQRFEAVKLRFFLSLFFIRSSATKKLGKVKNFQLWVPEDFFSKGQKHRGWGVQRPPCIKGLTRFFTCPPDCAPLAPLLFSPQLH